MSDGCIVKWLHAPGHAGSVTKDVVQYATMTKALVIDWSEMYWNTDELLAAGKGYSHFIGKAKRKDSRGRVPNFDVVISTRSDAEVLHDEEFFVSDKIDSNIKYMPTRYGKARVIRFEGRVILIVAWHPQPNPMRLPKVVLPVYRRGVRRVEEVQKKLEAEFKPDLILNGGDLQLGPGKTWVYPNQFAKRNGMRFRRHKIDWQMWKGAGFNFVSFRKRNPARVNNKMDHMWTVLTLKK